ncbi:calcium-binding and coiled-coil domain-containing protein 2 [Puma concolor]|uniref:Calcium-binding and coiled-coil domain-containing protein 2 n=1 Tax=Puma concolor TaxID=9696 RepID=A0A6P6HBY2_PUMCO|nr:calcium-binding and coiled-coil domain-containing protein 2 [Puma concolor]
MWVSLPVDLNSDSAKQQEVQFKAYYLPKDDEYYQFCYVDQDGVVRGASIPFQFRPENEEDILVVTTQGEVEEIEQRNKELCKENQELKDTCVSLQKQNSDTQAELHKTQEELEILKSTAQKLEQEAKVQKDGWETELLQLKEQNQKMSSENEKMGVRVEQLQVGDAGPLPECVVLPLPPCLPGGPERESYVAPYSLAPPPDENAGLSRKLSENKIIYDALQKEKERLERENDLLKRENSRLLSYMGLDFDSLPYQVPTSDQGGAGQNPALVYGNPYSGIQESSAPSLLAVKKCPTCKSDFAGDILDFTSEQQRPQPLCLSCPICDKTFPAKEKQIFEDHVFCHSL